ncbi:hypothetical protein [Fodinicola feengrottensis]
MMAIRRVPPEMFRFAIGDNAESYVAIPHEFGEANERLEMALLQTVFCCRHSGST